MSELQPGPVPLYQQLASQLRREILAGVYRPGDRLPSEETLCATFGVSRITVRAALDQLVDAGLLWRQRGKGTFVSAPPVEQDLIRLTDFVEDMAAAGLTPSSRVVYRGEEPARPDVAVQLRLQPGTPIVRLDRLRIADNLPIAFDVTYLPLRYGRLLDYDRLGTQTIYQQMESQYGIPIVSGTFLIEARAASDDIAAHLQVPAGTPVLVICRTSYTEDEVVIYFQIRSYRADRVRYRVSLERAYPGEGAKLTGFAPVFGTRDDA